jgi:hypothetical protein
MTFSIGIHVRRLRQQSGRSTASLRRRSAHKNRLLRGLVAMGIAGWFLLPSVRSENAPATSGSLAKSTQSAQPAKNTTDRVAFVQGFLPADAEPREPGWPADGERHHVTQREHSGTPTWPFAAASRGSSVTEISFETSVADPYKTDLDTGWLPPGMPTQSKFYFYSSTGEMAVKLGGDLVASYDSATAVPGCTLTVRVDAVGSSALSSYSSDAGTRLGMRYRLKLDVGPVKLKAEDYVPFIPMPDLDFSYKCPESPLHPFSFDTPDTACVTQNGKLTFCAWSGGGLAQSCVTPTTITSFIDVSIPCLPLPFYIDASSFSIAVPTPPLPVELAAGGAFGRCALYTIETNWLRDKGASPIQELNQDADFFEYDVYLPCHLAAATQGPREHHFSTGPYELDAGLLRALLRRAEPTVGLCAAKLYDFTLSSNLGFCVPDPQSGNILTSILQFNDVEADHTVRIVDPVVRNIQPSGGVVGTDFVNPVPVTWQTSWGAPDKCGCQSRVFYRLKNPITQTWGAFTSVHPESAYVANSGRKDWQVPPTATCQLGQIKVELYDPQRKFLHTALGDSFLVSPAPQVAVVQPQLGDSVCVGDTTLLLWQYNLPSGCTLDPQAFDLHLLYSWNEKRTIALGLPATPSPSAALWNIPASAKSDSASRIIVGVRNQYGTVGRDTSSAFAIVQPAQIGVLPPQEEFTIGTQPGFFGVEVGNGDAPGSMPPFGRCGSDGNFAFNFAYLPGGPPLVTFVDNVDGTPYDLPGDYFVPGLEPQTSVLYHFAMLPNTAPPDLRKSSSAGVVVSRRRGHHVVRASQVDTFMITATSFGGFNPTVMETLYIVPDTTATDVLDEPLPTQVRLERSFPNPFKPGTSIHYSLPSPLRVRLRVFDVAGRLVRVLVDERQPAGRHQVAWNGCDRHGRALASGVYFYRLEAGTHTESRSIVLVR